MLIDASKDKKLTAYKSLLTNFYDYYQEFPMTVSSTYLEDIVKRGKSCIPDDERVQDILLYIMSTYEKSAACVQHLLNDKFDSLPPTIRPIVVAEKGEGTFITAKWTNDTGEHTSIWAALNTSGSSKGYWSIDGKKSKLVRETI